jgi:hypothetical protein
VFSWFTVTLPNGASDLILGVIMAAMLLFRPQGLTGGAEFSLAWVHRLAGIGPTARKRQPEPAAPDTAAVKGE